jgi:hypothetical protein
MKLSRKLIPAFAMLLVSAVLMSTASFAWFSMNKDVTVSNISVSAKSDSIFLQIKDQTGDYSTKVDTAVEASLYPVAIKDGVEHTKTNLDLAANWYYMNSASSAVATGTGEKNPVANLTEFVQILTYQVRNNSDAVAENIHISTLNIDDNAGLKMIFVCGEKVVEVNDTTAGAESLVLADSLDKHGEITVTVYIYIDGNDEKVTSDNYVAGLLADKAIGFTISGTAAANN